MSVRWRVVSTKPSANSMPACRSSQRSPTTPTAPIKSATIEKELTVTDAPNKCHRCGATRLWRYSRDNSHIVYDLKFTRRGIKRWAVQYHYSTYVCSQCRAEMTIYSQDTQYGPNLRAFVIYLLIELRLSYQKTIEHVSSLFDVALPNSTAYEIKSDIAEKYFADISRHYPPD